MNITFSDIKTAVKKQLAVIGKRTYNKEGVNKFSAITLSSAEEPVLDMFLSTGLQNVQTALAQLIVSYSESSTLVTMQVKNTRGMADFDTRCCELVKNYLTYFVLSEYLSMVHNEMAEMYTRNAVAMMGTLTATVYHKNPPK